ncbi:MAG: hypothetical protein K2I75_07340 [Clostridiales bacterium]|nr:hypothetical protein [Clostridiales bacterium]
MTKLRNKIVLVLLALCLAVCAGLFVACGGDDPKDNSVTYTVTIMAGDTAAEGVQVTVKKGSTTLGKPATTDSDGKAEFKLAEDAGYTVTLTDLPRGYKLADGAELKFDENRKLEIALEEKPVSYTIKLVNPDNTAYTAAGVLVGICTVESNNCLELVEPDANGIVKIYDAAKTDYHIQIKGLPAGYAFESDGTYAIRKNASGNYTESNGTAMVPVYVELTDTVVEQTITVYPVNVITLTDAIKIPDAELESDYWYVDGMSAYKMNIEVAANSTAYYEYTADYSGSYNFYSDNENLTCKLNESFLLGDSYLSGNGMFIPPITMEKGKKYYLNVTNNGDEKETAEAILSTPYATFATVTAAGTVKAEVNKQGKNAVVELEPTLGSTYKLTVNGNGAIKQAASEYMVEYVEFEDADYTDSKELIVKYTEEMQGNLYFAVSIKGDNYPASAEVKIERIGTHTNQTIVVQPANLTQTAAPEEGKELIPVALNATVVKGTDGKYHLGNATGPIVYVNLYGEMSVSRYAHNLYPLVYMELAANGYGAYVLDATPQADVDNANKGKTFKDFRMALRGFEDYSYNAMGNPSIPADLAENYYGKYVNDDGLYPLDDTLKEFLELAATDPLFDTEWLFACYYYGDVAEPDALVGEYETEDRRLTLIIEKFGGFTIQESGEYNYYEYGTWTKSGETYTFVCKDAYDLGTELTYADGSFTYYDGWDDLIFTVPADPIVGNYADVNGTLVYVNRDGTYTWGEDVSGTWSKNADNDYYTIYNESNQPQYTAQLTEEAILVFAYGDDPMDFSKEPLAELYVVEDNNDDEVDISGLYEYENEDGTVALTVYADNTFDLDNNGFVNGGFWTSLGDGLFEFTVYYADDSSETFDVEYDGYSGMLTFYAQPEDPEEPVFEATYVFTPVVEEEDGDPDFADLYSTQVLLQDETISQARLGLYSDGKCILWQFSFRTQTYEKIATATWGADEDGSNVTISGITVADGYEYEITAGYAQGVVTVTLHMDGVETDTVYTFNMLQA